jgi:hypothetical protein
MYDIVLYLMSFSESYTAMYSYVPCMVYKYPFLYIKVYTFLNLYIEVHTGIFFWGKVYTSIYLNIRFRSDLYHSMVQVPLKSDISVYPGIYLDIPHLVQVVGIPDGRRNLAHLGGGARGRGARGADFARGRGARGAGRRPPAPRPTLAMEAYLMFP